MKTKKEISADNARRQVEWRVRQKENGIEPLTVPLKKMYHKRVKEIAKELNKL